MTTYRWSQRSRDRLATCHPLLQTLFHRVLAVSPFDLTVLCGHRNQAAQDAVFQSGASQLRWPRSKHNQMPSLAVDVAPWIGGVSWDWAHYHQLAPVVRRVWSEIPEADRNGWALEWGGDWRSFQDGPHWQLTQRR